MITLKRLGRPLLLVLVALGCSYSRVDAAQAESPKRDTPAPPERLVLDFSGSQNQGVPGGNFENFAFNLDTQQPMRKLSLRRGDSRKDVVATYDYADCTKGQESLLERPLGELAPGNSTWVDYVDIEMMPLRQRSVQWTGGVCYGYRNRDGRWHWNLTSTPLTFDPATGRVRARIWVKEAGIDALKLVFDYSVPRQSVRTVTITTSSGSPPPGK